MARLAHAPRPRSASGNSSGGSGLGGGFLGDPNGSFGGGGGQQQQQPTMKRMQHHSSSNSSTTIESLADLTRLLSRLQQSIMYPDATRERRLRTSEYERNKAETNLEYARGLLTRLEQDALAVKIQARRQELQADLNRKRGVYGQLVERLRELEEMSIDSDAEEEDGGDDAAGGHGDGGGNDTDDTEDLLGSIVMTPSESTNSMEGSHGAGRGPGEDDDNDEQHGWGDVGYDDDDQTSNQSRGAQSVERHIASQPSSAARQDLRQEPGPASESIHNVERQRSENAGTTATSSSSSSQVIRARRQPAEQGNDTAHTTQSSATATARAQLFSGRTSKSSATTDVQTTTATTEAVLDHQRAEQDALTENLVRMAASLKKSSQAFSTSLEQEKDVLDATGKSLERNELGLEGASRRMGAIRKMSEGQGWLGRMKLYAMIFGLAVAAVLLVFVMPKLRF
ncbi:unconventional SNARE in the endoplasmic reticulum protein 1 [Microdochium nivale]|nr:unconventional SNARE in the endoplasmic reticulum protein 1 [Microdochium nivale]